MYMVVIKTEEWRYLDVRYSDRMDNPLPQKSRKKADVLLHIDPKNKIY